MITSLSKHAPERHTGPSRGHGIASLCLATQKAESRSLTTSYGLSGQIGSMPAPGLFAIAAHKAIARLIEGVLRSLPHQRAAFGFNEHVRNAVHLAIKAGDMLFELGRKALAFDCGHFAVRSAGDDQGARLAGYGVSVGLRDDGHLVAPFRFLTYGNALSKSSTKMPKGRK